MKGINRAYKKFGSANEKKVPTAHENLNPALCLPHSCSSDQSDFWVPSSVTLNYIGGYICA